MQGDNLYEISNVVNTFTANSTTYQLPGLFVESYYQLTDQDGNTSDVIFIKKIRVFSVTGGGTLCNETGIQVSLSESQKDVDYELYRDGALVKTMPGSPWGGEINFADWAGFTTPGVYTVIAVGSDCSLDMDGEAVIANQASASFSFDTSGGCANEIFEFTSTVTGGIPPYTYVWVFGNDAPISTTEPVLNHQFNVLGDESPVININHYVIDADGCESNPVSDNITITGVPDVSLTPNELWDNCKNDPNAVFELTVTNNSSTAATNQEYVINWGDGSTESFGDTFTTATHTYNSKGAFTLDITVNGPNGCSSSQEYTVFNGSNPTGGIAFNPNWGTLSGCAPHEITFLLNGDAEDNVSGTIYTFDFGDNTPPLTLTQATLPEKNAVTGGYHITHEYNTSSCGEPNNTFVMSTTVVNPCATVPGTVGGITISKAATPDFMRTEFPVDSIIVIEGQSVRFTNDTEEGCAITGAGQSSTTSYKWDFDNDGTIESTEKDPYYAYNAPGIYTANLKAYTAEGSPNNCGEEEIDREVIVLQIPEPSFDITAPPTPCVPYNINLENTTTYTGTVEPEWFWNISPSTGVSYTNNTDASSKEPSLSFSTAGVYTITLITRIYVNGELLSEDYSINEVLNITSAPEIIVLEDSFEFCGSETYTFDDSDVFFIDNGTSITDYEWILTKPDNSTEPFDQEYPTITFEQTGTYTLSVNAENSCGVSSPDGQITVYVPAMIANNTISSANNEVCEGEIIGNLISGSLPTDGGSDYVYEWEINNGSGWILLAGENGQNLDFQEALTQNSLFRRRVNTLCYSDESDPIEIVVNENPVAQIDGVLNVNYGGTTTLNGSASSGGTPGYAYFWDGPVINPTNVETLTAQLASETTFTLTVTDQKGCEGSNDVTVSVTGEGIVVTMDADAEDDQICHGSFATITANATGGIGTDYTYTWTSIPTGSYPPTSTIIVSPTETTAYFVIVNDGFIPTEASLILTVNNIPSVSSPGSISICSGESTNYTIEASNAPESSFDWTVSDPSGGGVAGAFNGSGDLIDQVLINSTTNYIDLVYTITPTGKDPTFCPGEPFELTVRVNPVASVTNTENSQIVISGQVSLAVPFTSNVTGVIYNWTSTSSCPAYISYPQQTGTGNIPAQLVSINPDGPESCDITYEVIPTVNGCPGNPFYYTITVNTIPTIFGFNGPDVGGTSIICDGETVELTLNGSENGVSYQLTKNGTPHQAPINGDGNPITWIVTQSGNYQVIATNINSGLSVLMQGTAIVTVEVLPELYTLYIQQPGDHCLPIVPWLNGSQISVIYELSRTDFSGNLFPNIQQLVGTGNALTFATQTEPGYYNVTAYIDHGTITCSRPMNGTIEALPLPFEFTVIPQGIICEDIEEICLSGSESGVEYQLWLNNQPVGNLVIGDGNPICLGSLNEPGLYSIWANNPVTECETFYQYTFQVEPLPEIYTIAPIAGCEGTEIVLNNCQGGIDYYLYFEPASNRSREFIQVAGPLNCAGGSLSFGPQYDEGIYFIKAVNPTTNCSAIMDGITKIYPNPEIFDMIPQGTVCGSRAIYLDNFEADATYFLYRNDTLVMSIEGSSGSVNFGEQSTPGIYYIRAQFNYPETNCAVTMQGTLEIFTSPRKFTLKPENPSCPPTAFYLSDSEIGVTYYLWYDGFGERQMIPGTGGSIYFAEETEPGNYWVVAKSGDNCETQMTGIREISPTPTQYAITPDAGQWCNDQPIEIGLANSDVSFTYELYRNGLPTNPQAIVVGTGAAISFGTFTNIGTYRVKAVNDNSLCEAWMLGQLSLNNPPNIYNVTANGDTPIAGWYCPPVEIGLRSSQTGVNYTLHSPYGNTFIESGTGAAISFGNHTAIGEYTITAFNPTTSCSSEMSGKIIINEGPEIFELSSNTLPEYCEGELTAIDLILNYSSLEVSYQLYKDNIDQPILAPVTGTGSPLSWMGISQFGPGSYFVVASFVDDPTCNAQMYGVVNVEEIQLPVANISGIETICETYCIDLVFNITASKSFILNYTANNQLQAPLSFNPGDDYRIQVCPTVNTEYEIQSIEYTEFPYCVGTDISGSFDVIVEPLPAITVNNPGTTCIITPFTTSVLTSNTGSYEWIIVNGNGSISPSNAENTTYTPSAGDEGTTVILQLTAWGMNTCSAESVSELVEINVEPIPQIDMGSNGLICETETYTTSTTILYGSTYLWEIVSGNGSINPKNEPNTTYIPRASDAGTTVRLRLTVYGSGACAAYSTFDEIDISIIENPTALFSVDSPVCENELVTFTNQSSTTAGIIEQWVWDFGDGSAPITINFPDNPNATHTYTISGAYTVSLLVTTNNGCTDLYATEINISPAPVAVFGYNGGLCAESEIDFFDLSQENGGGNIMSWNWDFGDGTISTEQSPSHIFNAAGDYDVSLTVTNIANCVSQPFVQTITIGEPITVTIDDTDLIACLNDPHQFNGISPEAVWWNWDFGDGTTSTLQNPTHTYTSIGNYMVTLTGSDINGCQNVDVVTLTVSPNPIAFFTADQSACVNEEINFIDASISPNGQIAEWLWDMGDGTVIGPITNPADRNVVHQYVFAGSYEVELTVTDVNGCTDAYSRILIIENGPLANFTFQAACEGQAVIFTDLSTPNGGSDLLSWQWNFNDPLSGTNNTSNLQNPSHIFVGDMPAGGYVVTLTVTNTQGCFNTIPLPVEVNQNQTITIFADQNPVCLGNPIQFSSDATNVVSWQWNFGDGNSSTQANPSHNYQLAGNYNVTLNIQDDNGCTASATQQVKVNESPTALFTNTTPGCGLQTISFTDLSVSPNGAIVDWLWDFGDGNNSTDQNPTNEYLTAGTFIVSLSVTDATGCTDTYQKTITIKTAPIANFAFEAACVGQPVIFTDLSSVNNGSNIIGWQWNFGDPASGTANNSTVQNPTHIFVGNMPAGGFTVSLTVTNVDGCADTFEAQLELNEGQTITITTDNDIHCFGEIVQFSSNATNVESWLWNFGDGNTSTQANPTHIYQFAGNYNVTLNIRDANGCTASDAHQIKVNELPTANFSNSTPGCPDETIHFTDLSISPNGGIVNWHWEFGDGNTLSIDAPNDPNVEHIYVNSGTYNVTLSVTDVTGCEDSFTRQIVIEDAPLANFNFTQTCFGEPVLFTDLSSPNGGSDLFSWAWDFGDPLSGVNNSSTLQNPSHLFSNPGVYTVSLTVTNTQGCSDTFEAEVTVSETVDIDFEFAATAFCPGEIIDFTPIGDNIVSYEWSFGDGGTSIQQTPIYIYTQPGTYTVSLLVTAIDGCQGYVEHDVVINEEPVAAFSTDSPSCSGDPTLFFNASNSPTGYITEWIWNFGDGSPEVIVAFPDNPDVQYTYAANGTYNATLTVTNTNGCSNSISHEVVVAPGPVAAFDHNGSCAESPVSFIDLSQENGGGIITNWQWNFDDLASGTANTSTLQNPEHSFTAPGDYNVELIITNINGCTSSVTNIITIDEALQVEITVDNETPCLGTSVNFSGTAAGAVIWHWDFGDGNTANGQNTTHTYTETGSFTVVLTAETPEGCSNTATLTMVVNPAPVSRFISSSPACSSESVLFTNQSTTPNGFIQTYIWDMGDGNVITVEAPDDPNIEHLYAIPGTYEVSLTVIDNSGCENTSSKLVQVEAGPIADFTQDESCFGTPTLFTDLTSTNGGSDLYGWQWWFGDPNSGTSNTSTLQNPSHRFTEAGTFTVTLIVTNTSGCTNTIEKEVIVKDLPEVDFTIVNDQLCLNTAAEFNGIGENINTWFWEFGDGGTSYGQNTTYMYAEPGQYTVTLTVTGINQCQNSVSYPIFINDAPIADFRVDNTCLEESTQFFDQSISLYGFIETWEWDFGDGNTSIEQNPEHVFENADDYLVSLTVTDNFGCFETISRWVSIYEKPTAAFSFNQVCDPEGKVFFFNESETSPNGSPIMVYHWSFHDGYSSSDINPNHIFPEPGTCYEVSLTITDAFGCESTATQEICIWETLTIDFTSTEVCQGFPTEFEASYLPEDDEIVSYAWDFNDGSDIFLTFEETTSHIFPQAGTYFVELTATNINGCEKTIYREVKVNGLPLPDFSYEPGLCDDPVAFTDLSDGNGALVESWFWDFGDPDSGDDNFSDLRNPSHLYNDQGGTYQVKLTVTNFNGCEASITKEVIQDPCVQASFIVPNITLCADATICFTDNSYITTENGSIDRWIWNFGDNTPDYEYTELENPVCHEYSDREGGDFVVSLTIEATVNGSPFSHTHTETITIYPKPTARFIPEPVCQNTRAQFTDNSLGNGSPITNWFWDFGDETTVHDTSSMKNTSYRYPDYGLFDVQLVVSNAFDCTDTLISEIEIYQPPTADFIAVDSCASYITYFNDLTLAGGASINNYFWHFGDPNSNNDDGNPWTDSTSTDRWTEHIYNSPGTYFATLMVEDRNGCRDTVRQSLPVHPIPNASFTYEDRYQGKQGQVLFENTSDATATSFFWDFMTGDFSNEENPVFQFRDDGLYDVMLVAYNNHMCPDTAINQYEIVFTGLYFPNTFVPNSDDPQVNEFKGIGENLQTYRLEVYTSWGQLIWSSSALNSGKPAEAWDGTYKNEDLPTGSYIWKASATFKDGTIWEGSDNGDGNLNTYGILNLIR